MHQRTAIWTALLACAFAALSALGGAALAQTVSDGRDQPQHPGNDIVSASGSVSGARLTFRVTTAAAVDRQNPPAIELDTNGGGADLAATQDGLYRLSGFRRVGSVSYSISGSTATISLERSLAGSGALRWRAAVYRVSGGSGYLDLAPNSGFVTVTSAGRNHRPRAHNDRIGVLPKLQQKVNVVANDSDPDGDPLRVSDFTQARHGKVRCGRTVCWYAHPPSFSGADSFAYTVADGHGGSASARVFVRVGTVTDRTVNGSGTQSAAQRPPEPCPADGTCPPVAQTAVTPPFQAGIGWHCEWNGSGTYGLGQFWIRGWIAEYGATGTDRLEVHFRTQAYGRNFYGQDAWVTQSSQQWIWHNTYPDANNTWMPATGWLVWGWRPWPAQAVGYEFRVQYRFEWLKQHTLLPNEHRHNVGWITACSGQPTP